MLGSTGELTLAAFVAAALLIGSGGLAAAAPDPPLPRGARALQTAQEESPSEVSVGLEVTGLSCPNEAGGGGGEGVDFSHDLEPLAGAPCCASLCEQVCGIGEPCLCKRCQVLGCGV